MLMFIVLKRKNKFICFTSVLADIQAILFIFFFLKLNLFFTLQYCVSVLVNFLETKEYSFFFRVKGYFYYLFSGIV
jgi:hypothetical protein